ncbi:hypothetical protein [Croceicoccus sp. Ery5]|uniref:NAD(P)H-dependent amine dehydrogenase family protein n=1 Tax=Croceicoccus sp. Ery5 TaxID=1703340 RepID=UPI001E3B459F|nr:hypothetical protein [Croceicoccus sp. Ery5]
MPRDKKGELAMEKLRVVQWTTGKVGKCALRAILDDPRMELAGLYAFSPDKAGQDAAVLCDRPACGIAATDDIDALIAARPDAVVYTPFMADLDHLDRLLRAGIDVASTNLLLNCGGLGGEARDRIAAACAAGGSSFYITGVNPGWINQIAASLTAVCRRVDRVTIAESANVANYSSKETWAALGMGFADADAAMRMAAQGALVSFRDAVTGVAGAIGVTLDDTAFELDYATAAQDIDLGFMMLAKGTNAALRATWIGRKSGHDVVRLSVAWYLTDLLAEGWTFDDDHYHVTVDGEPGVDMRVRFVAPEWTGGDWSVLTALPAVNVLPQLAKAPAGIVNHADIALVTAPAGAWLDSGTHA